MVKPIKKNIFLDINVMVQEKLNIYRIAGIFWGAKFRENRNLGYFVETFSWSGGIKFSYYTTNHIFRVLYTTIVIRKL